MAPRLARSLKLMALAGALWIVFVLPWPGPAWVEPIKPTVIAVAFAVLSRRLRVGSWPLTITFCLMFFLYGIIVAYVTSLEPGNDMVGAPSDTRATMLYLWAMLFSPISLWGPVLFGSLAYAWASRAWSNNRLDRSRAASSVSEGGDR
jgi:hypothetical protein